MRNEKFKLPYCTYIWQGKAGKDLNGDGDIKNVAANPTAIPPTPEYKEEGWCFAYGEKEWVNPFNVSSTSVVDGVPVTIRKGATFDDYFDEAKDDENLQISCN